MAISTEQASLVKPTGALSCELHEAWTCQRFTAQSLRNPFQFRRSDTSPKTETPSQYDLRSSDHGLVTTSVPICDHGRRQPGCDGSGGKSRGPISRSQPDCVRLCEANDIAVAHLGLGDRAVKRALWDVSSGCDINIRSMVDCGLKGRQDGDEPRSQCRLLPSSSREPFIERL